MRLVFWVTALAVLSITSAKNSTAKTKAKPKRQLEQFIGPHDLSYSLVLPHSRVTQFRSLGGSRRISHGTPRAHLPPYAVQMEPVVQYSQKDPLYDPALDNIDDSVVDQNQLYAQSKYYNVQDLASEGSHGPAYGTLPTAPLYSHDPHSHHHQPQYYEAPEPIIEIIIKESNETLPAPPPQPIQKKKKEPVHVFYVKYSKDPHHKDKVIYEKPIPAITPPTNEEEDHHQDYVTVTPEPLYAPPQTTTLRAIIKPESEVYHSDSSVKITFGNQEHGNDHGHDHYSDRREGSSHAEDREETAPRPAIAFPTQTPSRAPLERSAQQKVQHADPHRPVTHLQRNPAPTSYRTVPQQAQSRIQFQPSYIHNEQQLPRQGPSIASFRAQNHVARQNPFGPSPSPNPLPNFSGPPSNFGNNAPTLPGPIGPVFPTPFPRPGNPPPSFHPRPSNSPPFGTRNHFNGPPRSSFHSGPQRPIQPQPYFDEPKYLQENYHTITTDQIESEKEQLVPSRPQQNFNSGPRPNPNAGPQFQDNRPQHIPANQQLPQQRPHQHFTDSVKQFSNAPRPTFFNHLKPAPPQVEDSRTPFRQTQQQFSFHQGPQTFARPIQVVDQHQSSFPAPIPTTQFLPQQNSPTLFNFHSQQSSNPEQQPHFQQSHGPSERPQFSQAGPSERPQFQQHGPSERPQFHSPSERPQFQGPSERPQIQNQGPSERPQFHHQGPQERPQFQHSHGPSERPANQFQDQANFHRQNVGQFVPNGGELVESIPKYEQHITVNGPTAQPSYSLIDSNQPSASASHSETQYRHQQQVKQQQQQQQQQQQIQQHQQQHQTQQQLDPEQEQLRLQLAQNVQKQQEEIARLQNQLYQAQNQQSQQQQYNQIQQYNQQQRDKQNQQGQQNYQQQSPRNQYSQERSKQHSSYVSSTSSPYYQTTSRTVDIKPTTQKYVSSTINSINPTAETKKEEKKSKKPSIVLPDEVPDDLRQQLLSSGILDNADISVLDYDKVGDTPLSSLPPDQLANFFSAGGAQQIAASEQQAVYTKPDSDSIQSRVDDEEEDDQELAASENVPSYAIPSKQAVEMKVVHFDPKTAEGQNIAKGYVKDDATQLEPVALNDKKFNRYLPLKVSGNQFPLPDVLKGRTVTSVVVLAPVETEALNDHNREERAASRGLKGIKFVAGESLQDVLRKPTRENFAKWLDTEKNTATDMQSVVLLVTGNNEAPSEREIYMYEISSGNVNKLSGDLSNAFVNAAENNSISKDIEKLAIEGEGIPENFDGESNTAEASENVPLLVDLSGLSLNEDESNNVSITSGYSKTKLGRSLRRH